MAAPSVVSACSASHVTFKKTLEVANVKDVSCAIHSEITAPIYSAHNLDEDSPYKDSLRRIKHLRNHTFKVASEDPIFPDHTTLYEIQLAAQEIKRAACIGIRRTFERQQQAILLRQEALDREAAWGIGQTMGEKILRKATPVYNLAGMGRILILAQRRDHRLDKVEMALEKLQKDLFYIRLQEANMLVA